MPRVTKTYTNDQRLLMEIRDHLEALPLAVTLQDVKEAKRIKREMDALDARLAKVTGLTTLLLRINGVHPERLSEDEIALLSDVEAISLEKVEELLAPMGSA